MRPPAIIDPTTIDMDQVCYDLESIRRGNPQRFEMEQLTAIVQVDNDAHTIVGYKDVRPDEFWVGGHIPGDPRMPGSLICEAAAQLCSFYCHLARLIPSGFLGFGGMEDVWFGGPVRPGDRLVVAGRATKMRHRQTVFSVQGFVCGTMVFHGEIIGVPLGGPAAPAAPSPT